MIDRNGDASAVGQYRREELPSLVDLIAVAFEDDLAMLRDRRGLLFKPFFVDRRTREDRNFSRCVSDAETNMRHGRERRA